MSFANKHCIVTGGTRGIGKQIVLDFAREGASVFFTYTSESSAKLAKELIASLPGGNSKHTAFRIDAGSEAFGHEIVSAAKKLFGERIDIIVHNAGFYTPLPLEQESAENWDAGFAALARSVMLLTQAALPFMPKGGRVVMLSSDAARKGYAEETVYGGGKVVLEHYARSWTTEFTRKRGITFNCVAPGWIRTEMLTTKSQDIQEAAEKDGVGEAADVSNVVLFLASEKARWISAAVIPVSGGSSMY